MRRLFSTAAAALALVAGSALTAGAAPPVRADAHAAISPSDWLGEVNLYRAAAGLSPVTENKTWDAGLQDHFTYLAKTDPSLMTGQYASAHTENPKSPYYTSAGAKEAGSSNLLFGGIGNSPVKDIDGWWTAPFHAIGMLRPNLTQVAFAQNTTSGDAAST